MFYIWEPLWSEYGTSFYNACISMVHTTALMVQSVEHNVPHQHTVCKTCARYWLTLMTLTFQHRLFLSVATHAKANRCSNVVLNTLQKHQYKTAPHANIVQHQAHTDYTEHAGLRAYMPQSDNQALPGLRLIAEALKLYYSHDPVRITTHNIHTKTAPLSQTKIVQSCSSTGTMSTS
jgi:hypothetical protein